MSEAWHVFNGSNGAITRAFLARLEHRGRMGALAAALFRAQKSSTRAKRYGRTAYRGLAYDRKQDALGKICELLATREFSYCWGWRPDPRQPEAPWVLYVELPNGQVSFHSPDRLTGPDYPRDWDGARASEQRILAFCHAVETSNGNLEPETAPLFGSRPSRPPTSRTLPLFEEATA